MRVNAASQDKLASPQQARRARLVLNPTATTSSLAPWRSYYLRTGDTWHLATLPDRPHPSRTYTHSVVSFPAPRSLAEWAVAERHLGPRLARAGREGRAQGRHQGSKRPPGQDPDRAFYLPFYLSAGIALRTARLSTPHPNPTVRPPQTARNLSQQYGQLGFTPGTFPARPWPYSWVPLAPFLSILAPLATSSLQNFTVYTRRRRRARSWMRSWRR